MEIFLFVSLGISLFIFILGIVDIICDFHIFNPLDEESDKQESDKKAGE